VLALANPDSLDPFTVDPPAAAAQFDGDPLGPVRLAVRPVDVGDLGGQPLLVCGALGACIPRPCEATESK
jgi:hypothetical protein